jgi:signal transduction histidine kinase
MMASGAQEDILSDLQRALDALRESQSVIQPVDVSIEEIKSVWSGICEIDMSLTPPVNYALKNNDVASQILSEILKEVISNAVRHGSASNIIGRISMKDSKTMDIFISNDGLEPTKAKIESVGSMMLDAVCLERSLEWDGDQLRTEFKAIVPINA